MSSILKQAEQIDKHQLAIGENIRAHRKELGLTLADLSEKSGLSTAFISLVERGKAIPSIVSLLNLAKALNVGLDYFIHVPASRESVRRKDKPERIELDSPVINYRLSGAFPNREMEAILIEFPPEINSYKTFPKVSRDGECFYYILEGELRFEVGEGDYLLNSGDSIHFDSRSKYLIHNVGEEFARVLWVGTPVLFEDN